MLGKKKNKPRNIVIEGAYKGQKVEAIYGGPFIYGKDKELYHLDNIHVERCDATYSVNEVGYGNWVKGMVGYLAAGTAGMLWGLASGKDIYFYYIEVYWKDGQWSLLEVDKKLAVQIEKFMSRWLPIGDTNSSAENEERLEGNRQGEGLEDIEDCSSFERMRKSLAKKQEELEKKQRELKEKQRIYFNNSQKEMKKLKRGFTLEGMIESLEDLSKKI